MSWMLEVVGIVYVSTLCVCVDFMYKWIIVYCRLVFEEEFYVRLSLSFVDFVRKRL